LKRARITRDLANRVADDKARSAVTLRSMAKARLAGGDQPFKGANLISKATLNVLEPSGHREITRVEEKRSHVRHKYIGFTQEGARLRSGDYI
jgi:hypothetical protein